MALLTCVPAKEGINQSLNKAKEVKIQISQLKRSGCGERIISNRSLAEANRKRWIDVDCSTPIDFTIKPLSELVTSESTNESVEDSLVGEAAGINP